MRVSNHLHDAYSDCRLRYKLFAHVFTALPLAALISPTLPPPPKSLSTAVPESRAPILSPDGKMRYFVCHGGLFSKDGVTLDEIRAINRIGKQPGSDGLMCELLWTDPQEEEGRGPSKRGKLEIDPFNGIGGSQTPRRGHWIRTRCNQKMVRAEWDHWVSGGMLATAVFSDRQPSVMRSHEVRQGL